MLVQGDLGFTGLVLVFLFFFIFGPVISFLIQKKWRIAVAKKEEIMRLVAMASEEAERAELEASGVYDELVVSSRSYKCAVCYCPTTTRCARCKLVRYCSGKCQIIHWRRGHREECHPPCTNSTYLNGPESDSDQSFLLQGDQYKLYNNDFEVDNTCDTKSLKRSSKRSASSKFSLSPELISGREDDKIEDLMDGEGTHINSRFSDSSCHRFSTSTASNGSDTSGFRFSTSTNSNEFLADVSNEDVCIANSVSRSKGRIYEDVSPDMVENTVGINGTGLPPQECIGSFTTVNKISCSSKLKSKIPSCTSGENGREPTRDSDSCVNGLDECTVTEPSTHTSDLLETKIYMNSSGNDMSINGTMSSEAGDSMSCDSGSLNRFPLFNPKIIENNESYSKSFGNKNHAEKVAQPEKMNRNSCTSGVSSAKLFRSSDLIGNSQSTEYPVESKGRRSLSSTTSERHPCCTPRRSSTSSVKPMKVDTVHARSPDLPEPTSSVPNVSNGLKLSVRKVVQQFKVPKPSKHNPFGLSEVAEKNHYKMLFPYDLFIKLYNWGKVELHPRGLLNCGNSCYANAVLQCLAFTQPLTAYLLQGLHSRACPKKEWCFTCEFECLIQKTSEGNSPLSPIGILSQLKSIGSHLGPGKEEDAHEFLRYAIDTMQSVCLKEAGVYALSPLAEETTLVGLIFGGYLRSKIKCMKCHGKSERHERMMDLTVEIQGDIGTLEEALGKFTATEILDGENKYLCSRCKSYEKAKKKLTVLEAPNVLTIAFKRFQSGKFGKLNKSIRFPEILNLAPYMSVKSDKSHVYRLYGVVVHIDVKNSAFSGHYVCYVKNLQGKWFKIDDSKVKPVELDRVLSKGAYMLLYSRCSPHPPGFIRNVMLSNGTNNKRDRSSEVVTTSNCKKDTTTKGRFNAAALRASTPSSTAHRRPENSSHQMTLNGHWSFKSLDPFSRRLNQLNRVPTIDSSSDSSSLFSCSDEGSCTTESTRNSTSTDDLSDYIFGESRFGWSSPWRGSDDSDVSCSSPFPRTSPSRFSPQNAHTSYETNRHPPYSAMQVMEADTFSTRIHREGTQDIERAQFLYSDTSRNCRNLANHSSSINSSISNSETNFEQLGWGNPLDVKSGVSMRRPTWERTAQTFY